MWREAIRAWWRIASGCGSGSGVSEATAATAAIGKCWSIYLVRAENGALYCGISDDPLRRFDTHCSGKGARFFHSSPARALVYVEACASKGDALRRERAIKALSKRAKERLLVGVPVLREVGEPAI
ncbi:TPA: GIY-YIG nuclease family protein [Pseudomonas aeruginosa]|nr:GIY-YIG nuclease family protein [Pseudomonas aeruginosa]